MKTLRRHLNYANVVATLALLFAMSGGALAAKHYLINSTKDIKPRVLKKLQGRVGKTGNPGAPGAAGASGAQGPTGPAGSALAYGHVTASATLDTANSSGLVDVKTGFSVGVYCLYGRFSPHVATATSDSEETKADEVVKEVGIGATAVKGCPSSSTGAPAVAIAYVRNFESKLTDGGFYITFN